MTEQTFERVTAAELRLGDKFAEARTHDLMTVHGLGTIGPSARRIYISVVRRDAMGRPYQASIRPRHTKKFWRATTTEGS